MGDIIAAARAEAAHRSEPLPALPPGRMVDRRGTPAVARRISVPKRGPTRDSLTVRFRG